MTVPIPQPHDQPEVRLSDAEREKVAEFVRHHVGEGRLTLTEAEERLDRVFAAKTRGELEGLFDDLPPVPQRTTGTNGPPVRQATPMNRSLASHAMVFAIVNAFLILVWLVTTPFDYFWPIWPIMGWGLGLALHAASCRKP